MDTSKAAAIDRAREFIDDILKINAEHGMRSVGSEDAYNDAIVKASRAYEQIGGRSCPAAARRYPSVD